ncbi:hypothetical protein L195_g055497, partial [Trifolium pratense]
MSQTETREPNLASISLPHAIKQNPSPQFMQLSEPCRRSQNPSSAPINQNAQTCHFLKTSSPNFFPNGDYNTEVTGWNTRVV